MVESKIIKIPYEDLYKYLEVNHDCISILL